MKTLPSVDVVIVGGGWTGLLMAKELGSRTTLSVVVLERGKPRKTGLFSVGATGGRRSVYPPSTGPSRPASSITRRRSRRKHWGCAIDRRQCLYHLAKCVLRLQIISAGRLP